MADLKEIFNGIQKRMTADFENISSQIGHNLSRGQVRERIIIKEYLARYIPENIGVGTGEIISASGEISNQMDIVLYDKLTCPKLLTDDYQIFPIECVYGVTEVKSNLGSSEIEDAFNKINRVKKMKRLALEKIQGPLVYSTFLYGLEWEDYFPIVGFVFGYQGISLDTLKTKLTSLNQAVLIHERLDCAWIMNTGGIINFNPKNGAIELAPTPDTELQIIETPNPLLYWTIQLHTLMTSARMLSHFKISAYLGSQATTLR